MQQSKACATANPERTLPTTEPAPRSDGYVRPKLQVADIAGHSPSAGIFHAEFTIDSLWWVV
ncbi:hypothetical protein XMIN_3311 [Xanthomonas citri pv. mangiferaeindicae LMG 941]|nr:hypothetical protein XMIN_3311 [Xanthomonas citri pv. mangiferaeindicae LMG 941]